MFITPIYLAYQLLLKPLMARRQYSQFPNATMKKKFAPLLGDLEDFIDDIENRIPYYYKVIGFSNEVAEYNYYLIQEGKGLC
jgi:hypothetical protein